MAIEFKCQNCQKTLRVADEFAGKKARCPNCQTILLVESDTETVEPIAVKPPVASAPQPPAYGQTGTPSASPFATGNPYNSPAQASQYRTPTRRHSRGEPHRAGLVFGLGIGAIVCNICLIPGIKFPMVKLRSMRDVPGVTTTNTAGNDVKITRVGRWLRRLKIDELPQLTNVLTGLSFQFSRVSQDQLR